MNALNRREMAKQYAGTGKWVALNADRKTVVGSGSSVQKALTQDERKGVNHPVITRMPKCHRERIGRMVPREDLDPRDAYPVIEGIMRVDDGRDPLLNSYQDIPPHKRR